MCCPEGFLVTSDNGGARGIRILPKVKRITEIEQTMLKDNFTSRSNRKSRRANKESRQTNQGLAIGDGELYQNPSSKHKNLINFILAPGPALLAMLIQ
ncbi:hypothetical protein RRG08_044782 [Elysia crispata]|uniref:Uncharacterized protein n=1 Tax=Elysia crispata TaxID=231223 RepID=A0AAE1DM68_9GAST|nr:hypothetical protein RRG08_044782 [Elysia crispata]